MFRKPLFWAVFILVSLICTAWAVMHFAEAFPLVTLDVKMDRAGALRSAEDLALEREWGPYSPRHAVGFNLDSGVQSFVELEAGGKQAWGDMIQGELYSPYTWNVRLFREGETNETLIRFRPDGTPYGFRERVAEDDPGPSLGSDEAREIAHAAVAAGWNVNLTDYEAVETSHEVRPGGRTDHSFVYERPDVQIGEGRYRLQLVVSGDRLTELTHFIKIPEAFSRRYQEMRAANNGIATGATFAIAILYLAGGCAVGIFFLMRERWVVWKPAVKWAVFIAFLQVLVTFNQWPLLWMGYDTAISQTTFALQQIAIALVQFVGMGAVLALSFIAAESLGRKAFPQHIQLWRAWTGKVAATRTMLGQTITGYLFIGLFFAYEVWLYFFAAENLGWWSPSNALFDPDVLANFFPWLTSIAISLQAGFWEECLFRAVPIASAALLGKRFGKPWLWITGAMLLQALIFGAGHASYPAQPAYARLVELIIPALGFGGLYLLFGLVPAIVFHFAFDVVWFALPLFAADTPGIWFDRGMVILITLIPLWIVLGAWRRAGSLGEVPAADYNSAWAPPPAPERVEVEPLDTSSGLSSKSRAAISVLGLAGLLVWGLSTTFEVEAPKLESSDLDARTAARELLAEREIDLDAEWRELSTVQASPGLGDRFVWQEGGPDAYGSLLGHYLAIPRRTVRYARFTGDVVERAEEYLVYVGPDGSAQRMIHRLPENRPGAELDDAAARTMALAAILENVGLEPSEIEEVSADPSQLPQRRDWAFVFKHQAGYPMDQGEARIAVNIAGDEVVSVGRYVHIPEEWERSFRKRSSATQVIQIACVVLLVLLYLAGAVFAVIRWSRHRFASASFAIFFGALTVFGAVQILNGFRAGTAQFLTAQPFKLQAAIVLVGGLIATTAIASATALLIGLSHRLFPPQPAPVRIRESVVGLGIGALLAGLAAVGAQLVPSSLPSWPDFSGAADSVPFLGAAIGPVSSWLTGTALLLLVVAVIHSATDGWQRKQAGTATLLVLLGLVVTGSEGVESIPLWLLEGLLTGLVLLVVWVLALRHHPALVPLVTATGAVLGALRAAVIGAYPGATAGSLIGAVLVLGASVWWFKRLTVDSRYQEENVQTRDVETVGSSGIP
jgi:hypothetical protein